MEMKSTVSKGSETPGTLLEGFGGRGLESSAVTSKGL